jgi:hypothetical protein
VSDDVNDPYQAPVSTTTEAPKSGVVSAIVIASVCFVVGYIGTPIIWFLAVPVPKNCPPPCDGPGMALAALLFVVGPIVGVVSALTGFLVRLYLLRRRLKSTA